MERMDQTLQAWLTQHGQRNLFDVMSEDECRDLLENLEARLSEETQLAEAAHSLHAMVQQGQQRASEDSRLTPPHGLPAVQHAVVQESPDSPTTDEPAVALAAAPEATAPTKPAPRRRWLQLAAMTCAVMLMGGWSLALYQWGYHQGSHQAHKSTSHQLVLALRTQLMKKEQKRRSQEPLALHPGYKLVEPLRLDNPTAPRTPATSTTSAALTALATRISLRSSLLLGQSSRKESTPLQLQWPLRDGATESHAEPSAIALKATMELGQLGSLANAQTDWSPPSRRLTLPPKQLPSSGAFSGTRRLGSFTSNEQPLY